MGNYNWKIEIFTVWDILIEIYTVWDIFRLGPLVPTPVLVTKIEFLDTKFNK